MRQTTIFDFIDDVISEAKAYKVKDADIDETPTVNLEDYLDNEEETSLLEDVVNNFLENCIAENKLPTPKEAKTLIMLAELL